MEVEVKYLLPKNFNKELFFLDEDIQNIFVNETDVTLDMRAFYYDTKEYDLKKNGLSFRIRYENNDLILTTKYGGGAEAGLHKREEININVKEDFLNNPSIEIFKGYEVYDAFKKALNGKKIEKLLEMEYERVEENIDNGLFNAIISIDDGFIITNNGKERVFELEIELISGSEAEMVSFGDKIREKYNLLPCNKSKLQRGFEKIK